MICKTECVPFQVASFHYLLTFSSTPRQKSCKAFYKTIAAGFGFAFSSFAFHGGE